MMLDHVILSLLIIKSRTLGAKDKVKRKPRTDHPEFDRNKFEGSMRQSNEIGTGFINPQGHFLHIQNSHDTHGETIANATTGALYDKLDKHNSRWEYAPANRVAFDHGYVRVRTWQTREGERAFDAHYDPSTITAEQKAVLAQHLNTHARANITTQRGYTSKDYAYGVEDASDPYGSRRANATVRRLFQ